MFTRLFLIASGNDNCYPSNNKNTLHLITEDPAEVIINSPFVCSPIFSLDTKGYKSKPNLHEVCRIGFFMIQDPFPAFGELITHTNDIESYWFTLGLANLVVFDKIGVASNIEQTKEVISKFGKLNALEIWRIEDSSAVESFVEISNKIQVDKLEFNRTETIPGYITFTISEYTISARKILDASSKFTPQYYTNFKQIFEHSKYLIDGLYYLFGDSTIVPSDDIEASLKNVPNGIENIINEKHGRLVQLNSALSYVYSQTYSGSFPIFDHNGIIRRHSLLGIGSANNALFEIVAQLEEAFSEIAFEEYLGNEYLENVPTNFKISEPREHNPKDWNNDSVRKNIIKQISPKNYIVSEKEYFSRFSFFSGRLGFREYDFSATSAIQVLVEGTTMQWNVINYTHEIIHNHVRIILNRILNISDFNTEFYLEGEYLKFIDEKRSSFEKVIKSPSDLKISYSDYFFNIILTYCIYSKFFGSLSQDWNQNRFQKTESDSQLKTSNLKVPSTKDLVEEIKKSYRDISEIFVHIIDLNYVYKRKLDIYIDGIWSSWATVPVVTNNIRHYVLRTLLTIASVHEGESTERFNLSISVFKDRLKSLIKSQVQNKVYSAVLQTINEDSELKALKKRFINCLPVADLVNNFFVCNLDSYLNRNDTLVGGAGRDVYDLQRGEFSKVKTISKIRLLLEQLNQSVINSSFEKEIKNEWESAWFLVALSSNNK